MIAVHFVTGNNNKFEETRAIVGDLVNLKQIDIDLPEIQGDFDEIINEKLNYALDRMHNNCWIMVEDTSLSFEAMGELPGPYVKWFLKTIGNEGLVKMLKGFDNNRATARCAFGIGKKRPGEREKHFVYGEDYGTIVPPREIEGKKAFGWDPIFQPDDSEETYAEMDIMQKNQVSQRAKALRNLRMKLSIL